jgi:putative tryptophan/tyrosine transport system substrate-binding protein
MERRAFISLVGGAAAAWPLAAHAQQQALPLIGYLSSGSPGLLQQRRDVFLQGLAETGYVPGRNVAMEYRWAEGHYDRLPELAAELVRRQVSVIVAADAIITAQAAKAATATIPIVFGIGADPVDSGLVASLNRPGGNLTGAARLSGELEPKRLQLLHEVIPAATTIALLVDPGNPGTDSLTSEMQAAARTLGLELLVVRAGRASDLDQTFASIARQHAGGVVIGPDPYFVQQSARLAALALEHALPAMFQYREFVAAGGLISFAGSRAESYRLVGLYTGRILKGAKPAELPVQQATTVELFINLKTAHALGISVPLSVMARANEVIE